MYLFADACRHGFGYDHTGWSCGEDQQKESDNVCRQDPEPEGYGDEEDS